MNKSFILLVIALFSAISFAQKTSFRMPKNIVALDEAHDNNLGQVRHLNLGPHLGSVTPHFGMSGGNRGAGVTLNGGFSGPVGNTGGTWTLSGHSSITPGGHPGYGIKYEFQLPL